MHFKNNPPYIPNQSSQEDGEEIREFISREKRQRVVRQLSGKEALWRNPCEKHRQMPGTTLLSGFVFQTTRRFCAQKHSNFAVDFLL